MTSTSSYVDQCPSTENNRTGRRFPSDPLAKAFNSVCTLDSPSPPNALFSTHMVLDCTKCCSASFTAPL
eukprot:m.1013869 g.1013869  ORF g.1013869 m.1013869 type:complete len:69 (+) comp24068_c0_seq23:71-277(+)